MNYLRPVVKKWRIEFSACTKDRRTELRSPITAQQIKPSADFFQFIISELNCSYEIQLQPIAKPTTKGRFFQNNNKAQNTWLKIVRPTISIAHY